MTTIEYVPKSDLQCFSFACQAQASSGVRYRMLGRKQVAVLLPTFPGTGQSCQTK